jgi:hypothetical protein
MKKKYLVFGSLALLHLTAKSQPQQDSATIKPRSSEIELVYNHYLQNGNHSAVTGGTGTEKLTVYGPAVRILRSSGKNAYEFNVGADIITSASTDNIDFVISSASKNDTRAYVNGSYAIRTKHNLSLNGGIGASIESDYFSLSASAGLSKSNKQQTASYSAQFSYYNDDLRWGRLNEDYHRPVKLIYPSELRYKEWYDVYKRYSYNARLGFTRILNKRNTLGIFPEFGYQNGLLSTPFHRVFLNNGTEVVENLPPERFKMALALQWNTFIGGKWILKNTVNGYHDDFGINAFSVENETAIKITPVFTLMPGIRFHWQDGSRYFAPYRAHSPDETYYTSDYDLSHLQTYSAGMGLKFIPQKYLARKYLWNSMIFRYNYLYRTDRLHAHILSLVIQTTIEK